MQVGVNSETVHAASLCLRMLWIAMPEDWVWMTSYVLHGQKLCQAVFPTSRVEQELCEEEYGKIKLEMKYRK